MRYRVDDLDRGDRVARLGVRPGALRAPAGRSRRSDRSGPGRPRRGWRCRPCGCAAASTPSWPAPCRPRGSPSTRPWSTAPCPPCASSGRARPARVLVLAPRPRQEADALLGRAAGSGAAPVAATTEGPTGTAGTATGDRVVLDPTAFGRLTASGRDVVLTHELAHVAVRSTVPGRPAAWLAEGYADHVGYARADVSTARLVAPLVAAIRTGHGPRRAADRVRPAAGQRRHRGALPRGVAGRGADRRTTTARPPCAGWSARARRPARTPTPRPPPTRPWCRCSAPPGPS